MGAAARTLAHRVAPVYELLKWKWSDGAVPDEEEIYEHIIEMLENFDVDNDTCHSCGGITIEMEGDTYGRDIKIYFSVDEYIYNV